MLAEWTGLEPATPGVTGRYSNQLNYHSALEGAHRILQKSRRPTGISFGHWRDLSKFGLALFGGTLQELPLQGTPVHFQGTRGGRDIAGVVMQHPLDMLPLDTTDRQGIAR